MHEKQLLKHDIAHIAGSGVGHEGCRTVTSPEMILRICLIIHFADHELWGQDFISFFLPIEGALHH
jgi:hypothetical protein